MADTATAPRTRAALAPWNMRDTETARAYQAFERYRDMGVGRTLDRVHREFTGSSPLDVLKQWSMRHDWPARVAAFDAEVARRASAKSLNDHAEVRNRQAKLGRLLQARGEERIASLDPMELAPMEAVKVSIDGAKLEREALGIGPRVELADADGQPLTIAILRVSVEGL